MQGCWLVARRSWTSWPTVSTAESRSPSAVRRGDPGAKAALSALADSAFQLLPVEPLQDDEAEGLVRAHRPELTDYAVDRIVERAAGNPLLLEELGATGEPTETLRLSITG